MNNVVDFESRLPHSTGQAQCRYSPEHVWQAVFPTGANPWLLECPKCRRMSGHIPGAEASSPYEARVWAEQIWSTLSGGQEEKSSE